MDRQADHIYDTIESVAKIPFIFACFIGQTMSKKQEWENVWAH